VSGFLKKKKGQAAIEFLTTYGWAMMAVVVIIGSLSYFDLLDTKRFVSEKCDLGSQIQCMEVYANDDTGGMTTPNFKLAIRNNYPVNIRIMQVNLDGKNWLTGAGGVPISAGESYVFTRPISQMSRGSKEDMAAVITFRRDAGAVVTKSYNITGNLIVKVQNHDTFPIAEQKFICGNRIVEYLEDCDMPSSERVTCESVGRESYNPGGSPTVRCDSVTCKWNYYGCK